MARVAIMGSGSWGTAFGMVLSDAGSDVVIWGRDHAQLRLLRASFVTACKQVLKSFTLEAGDYADPTDVHAGEQQTLRVSFLDIVETIDLPTTAPADDTNPTLTPDAGEEVVLTDVTDIPQLDT